MNLPPRQQQILELVRDRGYVSIEEMAQLFVVTPQTIRRDINQLAELDLLRRYHGGAAYDSSVENTAYAMRADQMRDEKQRIARLSRGRSPIMPRCSSISGPPPNPSPALCSTTAN